MSTRTDNRAFKCLFCEILTEAVPTSFVYRDQVVAAFLDIRPMTRGHTLVVPQRHRPRLGDLSPSEGAAMVVLAQRIASAAATALGASGVNVLLSDGAMAGQEVAHSHLHVIPRYTAQELAFTVAAWEQPAPSGDDLDAVAALLHPALPAT